MNAAASEAASGSNRPTQQQISSGYFGSSRATLDAVLAGGGVVNTLSYLTSADIELIQKATGITIKDGLYYNSNGDQVGNQSDSQGHLTEPGMQAAYDLAQTLSDLRVTGGPHGDASLQNGRAITADDLEAYLDYYAKQNDKPSYLSAVNTIKQAEALLFQKN
ncbi:hypothetical protein SAMN06265338_101859 [Rhodoblastus acidophilus]|uniref:Uncharacterized protein n=2 Tax=Rhodoblastus acidophilus TaxID=1074 RepID=A0A212QMI3_RHOAC|nr:hypothetical protein CKO16_07940 [Rhodoblastus acidophilus]RAI18018.1 hypothetical protein CH337_15075 [Rhodoblastus acidophilus]SNB60592.1 hypothetical protein SAMN06265338_101859 [Rhodoblastus acidophilus]